MHLRVHLTLSPPVPSFGPLVGTFPSTGLPVAYEIAYLEIVYPAGRPKLDSDAIKVLGALNVSHRESSESSVVQK